MSYHGSGASSRAQKVAWLRLRPGLWSGKVLDDDLQFLIKNALVDAGLYSRTTNTWDMNIASLLASATGKDVPYARGETLPIVEQHRGDYAGHPPPRYDRDPDPVGPRISPGPRSDDPVGGTDD